MRSTVDQTKPQAIGHRIRTGHQLTGHYVPTDHPGIVRLVRTCACASCPQCGARLTREGCPIEVGHDVD